MINNQMLKKEFYKLNLNTMKNNEKLNIFSLRQKKQHFKFV